MKITVLQENLKRAWSRVGRAVSTRPQLPVLANILVEAKDGKIFLTGTDLELGIRVEVGAKVEIEGKTTIPAKMFGEFISSIPSGKVELNLEKETLKVRSGRYKASFQTIEADEFPQFPIINRSGDGVVRFKKHQLEEALGRVSYAAAKDSMRPILTGVLMELGTKKWRLVATDGFRLALFEGRFEQGGARDKLELVVPLRGVSEIGKLDGEDVGLLVLKDANQVAFWDDEAMVVSQLLDGSYPNYKKIIPDDSKIKIKIGREDLLEGVRVSQVFARDNSNVLEWRVFSGGVKITSKSPELGENEVVVEADVSGGEEEVAFNGKFLLDFLQNSKADQIEVGLGGNLAPGSFKESGRGDFLYIVMPINL